MTLRHFKTLFCNFHRAKEFWSGLQAVVPAASITGHFTCRTTSQTLQHNSYRCLNTSCAGLLMPESVIIQQKCYVRKVYPNPFEQDPEHYLLPPEKEVNLDLNHVPALGNQGPELVTKVQEAIKGDNLGRLFAVVHIGGVQRKITTEDVIIVNGFFPPQIGDRIRLEKVMLVGGRDFTLYGRPLLNRDMIQVKATVIEKTLSHVRLHWTQLKRYRRLKLHQHPQTVLVINSIEVDPTALS